ncbi:unnamed protein product [Schistosoma mattheei]|uniref:Uncharacterized protein n=2 Tax=Schistosoma TaxID=6181 RepID=A0A3P8BJS3_9TREM|nr:unnamed protein product [Schistosoma mattheei]
MNHLHLFNKPVTRFIENKFVQRGCIMSQCVIIIKPVHLNFAQLYFIIYKYIPRINLIECGYVFFAFLI